jgi:hypothetical protein
MGFLTTRTDFVVVVGLGFVAAGMGFTINRTEF